MKKIIPKSLLSLYHLLFAYLAVGWCGHPSEKMVVIGVTGTNGKSTTVNLIGRILEQAGHKVGWTSTLNFKIADREWMNKTKMTMPGRFALQKMLSDMVRAGCKYAIVETSSEGIKQHRHIGIDYDLAVFTNLTPEHIEAHGGFENYKKAKGELFKNSKIHIINGDDQHAEYFLQFPADRKVVYGCQSSASAAGATRSRAFLGCFAQGVKVGTTGSQFKVDGVEFKLKLLGEFNVYNALAAIATARALGVELEICKAALEKISGIPGRAEIINEGQNFTVIVDYAYEPAGITAIYSLVDKIPHQKIIHVTGSAGGGRDVARRPVLGRMAGYKADYVVVTNEDPYDDNPQEIINAVAKGAEEAGKIQGKTLFCVLDRTEGIAKALSLAQTGDLVLITGKGAEPVMAVANGEKIPWDDRVVVRREIKNKI